MTETTNINTLKGKILMMAVLLAALVAATAATAKPADATTTCGSYASAPYRVWINNTPYVQFPWRLSLYGTYSRPFPVCYAGGMDRKEQPKNGSKRPRPSYEDGELRDKSIEGKMDPSFRRGDLLRVIRDAAKGRKV